MESTSQSDDVVCESPLLKGDLAVQPLEDKSTIPVDGPVLDDTTAPSSPAESAPKDELTSLPPLPPVPASEDPLITNATCLASPFHTTKRSIGSDTTLGDGEVCGDIAENSEDFDVKSSIEEGEVVKGDNNAGETDISYEAGMWILD